MSSTASLAARAAGLFALGLPVLLEGCALPPGKPVTPQRPTFSFSPATTAVGTWELEAGAAVGPPDDSFEIPGTLKYGVSDHTEVALSLSPLIGVAHTTGLGDAALAWRHRFVDADGSKPAMAVQASVKLPTADEDDGLGSGNADAFGALTVGGANGAFGWVAYAQLGVLGQDGEGADLERDLALVGSWTLDPTNALFAELSDRNVHEQDSHVDQLRVGHSITARPDLVIDWSVWLPLSDDAQETVFAVGFTRNLGAPRAGP